MVHQGYRKHVSLLRAPDPSTLAIVAVNTKNEFYFDLADMPLLQDIRWMEADDGHLVTYHFNRKKAKRATSVLTGGPGRGWRMEHTDGDLRNNRRSNLRIVPAQQAEELDIDRSPRWRSVVTGMLLGDASISWLHQEQFNGEGSSGLQMGHSIVQREYVEWKADLLRSFGHEVAIRHGESTSVLTTEHRRSWVDVRSDWYRAGDVEKKRIPVDWLTDFDALGLAIWYMDDGGLERNGRGTNSHARIATYSFDYDENVLLTNLLMDRFGVEARIGPSTRPSGDIQYRLGVTVEGTKRLIELVQPFVEQVPCLLYKIDSTLRSPRSVA